MIADGYVLALSASAASSISFLLRFSSGGLTRKEGSQFDLRFFCSDSVARCTWDQHQPCKWILGILRVCLSCMTKSHNKTCLIHIFNLFWFQKQHHQEQCAQECFASILLLVIEPKMWRIVRYLYSCSHSQYCGRKMTTQLLETQIGKKRS